MSVDEAQSEPSSWSKQVIIHLDACTAIAMTLTVF